MSIMKWWQLQVLFLGLGVSSARKWWDSWQLKVFVLASLVIQYLLAILGAHRYRMPPLLRFVTWLSFNGCDYVAIFALGTVSSFQWKLQQCGPAHAMHDLSVFWSPILLMHLGGQTGVKAYSLKDNAQWKKQIIISLSKVTVAAYYLFSKSWLSSADNRLLGAAILLFISGTVKCIGRPINLNLSSFESLANFVHGVGLAENENTDIEEFVDDARALIKFVDGRNYHAEERIVMPLHLQARLFVDSPHRYADRIDNMLRCWALNDTQMDNLIRSTLASIFEVLYTQKVGNPLLPIHNFLVTWALAIGLPIVATGLFHSIDKEAYNDVDVIVTFLLLYGTLLLELYSMYSSLRPSTDSPVRVAQHNLFWSFVHDKKHSKLMTFARCLGLQGLLNQYWCCMNPCPPLAAGDITSLVRVHIQQMWENIDNGARYNELSNVRGQWILNLMNFLNTVEDLGWIFDRQFDECVLLFHIATDLCFRDNTDAGPGPVRCKQISNYLMHLLFTNPEMLLSGSRRNLCTAAYNQISDIIMGGGDFDDADSLMRIISARLSAQEVPEGTIIRDAWSLTERLMEYNNEDRSVLIQGMLVELLVFSAGRCRGELQVENLSLGGEYLSNVSLLLVFSGMPVMADRLQIV